MTVSTYKIEKNIALKKVLIAVGDKMTLPEAERFSRELNHIVSSIDASNYTLDVDCTSMKVLTTDLTEKLTGAMKDYHEAGFNKIVFFVQNDVILKMQLSRIARSVGLTNAEVITK